MKVFVIETEFIPLIQLLKACRIAQTGGEAQMLVVDGMVLLNGVKETRKRAKIRHGDVVECNGKVVKVQQKA